MGNEYNTVYTLTYCTVYVYADIMEMSKWRMTYGIYNVTCVRYNL